MERKHRNQMTQVEIDYVEGRVRAITEWDLATRHAEDRMREKNIKKVDVLNTLKYGAVIEVCSNGRVLLRLMKGMMKGTCVVASLTDRSIVTVWRNFGDDPHTTLNLGEYQWRFNGVDELRKQCSALA